MSSWESLRLKTTAKTDYDISDAKFLSNNALGKSFGSIVNHEQSSDFQFHYSDTVIYAHRCLLVSQSEFFSNMPSFKECCDDDTDFIDMDILPGSDPNMLLQVLEWMYTRHISIRKLCVDDIIQVMRIAGFFDLYKLAHVCETRLLHLFSEENVCKLFSACTHNSRLMRKCVEYLSKPHNRSRLVNEKNMSKDVLELYQSIVPSMKGGAAKEIYLLPVENAKEEGKKVLSLRVHNIGSSIVEGPSGPALKLTSCVPGVKGSVVLRKRVVMTDGFNAECKINVEKLCSPTYLDDNIVPLNFKIILLNSDNTTDQTQLLNHFGDSEGFCSVNIRYVPKHMQGNNEIRSHATVHLGHITKSCRFGREQVHNAPLFSNVHDRNYVNVDCRSHVHVRVIFLFLVDAYLFLVYVNDQLLLFPISTSEMGGKGIALQDFFSSSEKDRRFWLGLHARNDERASAVCVDTFHYQNIERFSNEWKEACIVIDDLKRKNKLSSITIS
jgi:hypothetical protein